MTAGMQSVTMPATAIKLFDFQYLGAGHHPPAGDQTFVGIRDLLASICIHDTTTVPKWCGV
eukprot:gene7129-453_t